MDYEAQLKLQAYLDGELPEAEAREVARLVAEDREAAGLLEELRNTGRALEVFNADLKLPESREFFWSKVRREIERSEAPRHEPAPAPIFAALRRLLVPASALALVFVVGVVLTRPQAPAARSSSPAIETALADSGAFTYRDYSQGTTLVWLSYPAENEVAETDALDTVE